MHYESLLFGVKRQRENQQEGREIELGQKVGPGGGVRCGKVCTPEMGDRGFIPEPGGQAVLVRAGVRVSQAWDGYPQFWVSGLQFLICRMGQ